MKKIKLIALQLLSIERSSMDNQIAQADISVNPNTVANEIKTFVEETANKICLNLWKEAAYRKMNTKLPINLIVEVNVDNVRLEYFSSIKFDDFYELEFKIENIIASTKQKMLDQLGWSILLNPTFRNQEWGEQ